MQSGRYTVKNTTKYVEEGNTTGEGMARKVLKEDSKIVVKDDKYVYVFDLNYDKVYSKDISELSASKLDIVYRRSNIYYEDKVRDKDKLTYKYYDVSTLEEVFDIDVGGI